MLSITGANGQLGRLIVEEVLRRAPDPPLAVSVRDASEAADLAERGVDVRQADYHDPDSLAAAFAGMDTLLLMPTPTPTRPSACRRWRPSRAPPPTPASSAWSTPAPPRSAAWTTRSSGTRRGLRGHRSHRRADRAPA